jgi:hypothetical protein
VISRRIWLSVGICAVGRMLGLRPAPLGLRGLIELIVCDCKRACQLAEDIVNVVGGHVVVGGLVLVVLMLTPNSSDWASRVN